MQQRIQQHFERIRNHPDHRVRKAVGFSLVIGGILGPFLPVLGTWMLPLGVVLLSADYPWCRRLAERSARLWRRVRRQPAPPPPDSLP